MTRTVAIAMLATVVAGCFMTRDENLWKTQDAGPEASSVDSIADRSADRPIDAPLDAPADLPPSEQRPDAPSDLPKADLRKPDAKRDGPKPDLAKPDLNKHDGPKPDLAKPDLNKHDGPKPDLPKPDLPKPDQLKPDQLKPDQLKPDILIPTLPSCTNGYCFVPAGSFMMGSPASDPCRQSDEVYHQVNLTRHFEMGATEFTVAQLNALKSVDSSLYDVSGNQTCGANCPVEEVTWIHAAYLCNLVSIQRGYSTCYTCSGTWPVIIS